MIERKKRDWLDITMFALAACACVALLAYASVMGALAIHIFTSEIP